MGRVTRGAVLGTLRTLGDLRTVPEDLLRGVGHGVLQGALEASKDPAAAAVVEGTSSAGQAAEEETAAAVKQALSPEPTPPK